MKNRNCSDYRMVDVIVVSGGLFSVVKGVAMTDDDEYIDAMALESMNRIVIPAGDSDA